MGMNIGSDSDEEEASISAINTTPLVDVMLVLLIIFLITIPVVRQSVAVDLPKQRNLPTQTKPENILISINRGGDIYWGQQRIADTDALFGKLKRVAVRVPQPEVHIRGDEKARYESIGKVVFACQRAGIMTVGFITEPAALEL
ncbi:MAG: biopolymer transporter ExbD [Sterolibacterium sp.]|nr:biopolymer transporter ExbD [Sterolibacterium sp.]